MNLINQKVLKMQYKMYKTENNGARRKTILAPRTYIVSTGRLSIKIRIL
jgi:hypothetical protein